MIRRKIEEEHDNHERWLVSYADFITLLFAFFVVMYAISSVNQKKYEVLSSSINQAFTSDMPVKPSQNSAQPPTQVPSGSVAHQPSAPLTDNLKGPLSDAQIRELQAERQSMATLGERMAGDLSSLMTEGKVQVTQNHRGLQIDISDSVLFAPGSAELTSNARDVLYKIVFLMRDNQHAIQVEGHTDDTPIHTPLFYSNWELSAVRASSVVRMCNDLGITEARLSAVGFGSAQPVSENLTTEGRSKNRRVSIVVLYDSLRANNNDRLEILPTPQPIKQNRH